MDLFPKKKKKGKPEFDRDSVIAEIEEIKKEAASSQDIRRTSEKFLRVMRRAFSRIFKIGYQFTYEELSADIKRKKVHPEQKVRVIELCNELVEDEYSKSEMSREDLLRLIEKVEGIMRFREEIPEDKKPGMRIPLLGGLFGKKKPKPPPSPPKTFELPSFDQRPALPEPPTAAIPAPPEDMKLQIPEAPPAEALQEAKPEAAMPEPEVLTPGPEKEAKAASPSAPGIEFIEEPEPAAAPIAEEPKPKKGPSGKIARPVKGKKGKIAAPAKSAKAKKPAKAAAAAPKAKETVVDVPQAPAREIKPAFTDTYEKSGISASLPPVPPPNMPQEEERPVFMDMPRTDFQLPPAFPASAETGKKESPEDIPEPPSPFDKKPAEGKGKVPFMERLFGHKKETVQNSLPKAQEAIAPLGMGDDLPDNFDAPSPAVIRTRMPSEPPVIEPALKKRKPETEEAKPRMEYEELPSFEVHERDFSSKKERVRGKIDEVLLKIDEDKKSLSDEFEKLKEEEQALDAEKVEIEKIEKQLTPATGGEYQEKITALRRNVADKESEIKKNQDLLQEKESLLTGRVSELKDMQADVTSMYIQVNEDKKELFKKENELERKEEEIAHIKRELESKNKEALAEISKFKDSLEEKQKHFMGLQDFYRRREEKLSVEESNLMDEKRRNIRFLQNNIEKHKQLLTQDLEKTELALTATKKKLADCEKEISSIISPEELDREKEILKAELDKKEKHFGNMENNFKSKEPEITKLQLIIDKKENQVIGEEKRLERIRGELDLINATVDKRARALEVRELEIRGLEKEAQNIKLRLDAKSRDHSLKASSVNKRIKDYEKLKNDVYNGLRNRQYEIGRLEEKLTRKALKLKRKGVNTDRVIESILKKDESIGKYDPEFAKGEQSHLSDVVTVSGSGYYDENGEPGSPALLEIYRLLNIAKITIKKKKPEEAKELYIHINNLYDRLPEGEKEEAFDNIIRVFKPRDSAHIGAKSIILYERPKIDRWLDAEKAQEEQGAGDFKMDMLIRELNRSIDERRMDQSQKIYEELQAHYRGLGTESKHSYYSKIMDAYTRLEAHH